MLNTEMFLQLKREQFFPIFYWGWSDQSHLSLRLESTNFKNVFYLNGQNPVIVMNLNDDRLLIQIN